MTEPTDPAALSDEVATAIAWLRDHAATDDFGRDFSRNKRHGAIADLLTRLSARVTEAERERDEAEAAAEGRNYKKFVDMRKRAESARADALEEAAKVVEAIADDRFREFGSTEPDTNASYYQGSQAEFYEAQDEENESCAKAIRALKQKEPQT